MKIRQTFSKKSVLIAAAVFSFLPFARSASQTWTNAPVDVAWTNVNNWVGKAVPGTINLTGNTVSADVATFNSAIPGSGIGGASNPIMVDDATISGDRGRQILGVTFDTANCGAYVISGTTPEVYPGTGILYVSHNGSIVMNSTVNNSEVFNIPVFIRLPSSTAGIYNFVNNAASSSATLFFTAVTNDSAATRGTTFILDGSNTGTNTIAALSRGTTTSGAMGLTKRGTGLWVLPNANDLASQSVITINNGTLEVQNAGSLGSPASATITSNGVLQIDGVTLNQSTLNLQMSGMIRMKGNGTVTGINVSAATGVTPTLATTASGDVLTVGSAANALTGGASDTILHVAGLGTVLLGQSANYVGKWSVDAGVLQVGAAAALGTGANLNIGPGATLDTTPFGVTAFNPTVSGIGGGGTGTSVSTAATIKMDPSGTLDLATGAKNISLTFTPTVFAGDSTHPSLYVSQGTLKLGGNAFSIDNASGTPLGTGTYLLIQQASGNVIDGGNYSVVGVTGGGLASGTIASVQVSGGNVNLVVAAYTSKTLAWKGGNPDATWDNNATANFWDGTSFSVFNNSDNITFDSTGAANPTVTLSGALAPGSVVVDTSANNYTFTGSGSIAGTTSLIKKSVGTLIVQTVNTYAGGTVVSNGVLQLGLNNAVPSAGGDVTVSNPGKLDLNTYSDTINGLNGNGSVDNAGGGASTLTVGNNDDSGTFSGTIQNTSGTLALTKAGNGTQSLTASNSYAGATTLNAGTLKVSDINALGAGASALTINAGTLDVASDVLVASLNGGAGNVVNNSTTTTNSVIIQGASTFSGLISDGSGPVKLVVNSGTLRLNGANTYSGGTILAAGTGLTIGSGAAQAGTGAVIASNNVTFNQPNTSASSSTFRPPITTVDNATVTLTSSATANAWANNFNGSSLATNIFSGGNMSLSGALSFSNFLGTVIISGGGVRIFNAVAGGDNTTFVFTNGGGMNVRDAGDTVHLGALSGNGSIFNQSVFGNYWIGGKNIDCTFAGAISGANNIVKIGTGRLTLAGYANAVGAIDGGGNFVTNYYWTNVTTYIGSTTISNGVLAIAGSAAISNSPTITLATSNAVLDASQIGYIDSTGTNVVTTGVFELISGQTLTGLGTVQAVKLLVDSGAILNVGLQTGTLTATNDVELAGVINMAINPTNAPNSSELVAGTFTIDPTATLVVTNLVSSSSSALQGAVFQLFNHPVTGFTSVTLPTLSAPFSFTNRLSIDGSIAVLGSLINTNTFTMTNTFSGGNLTLSWPSDRTGWRLQVQTNTLANGLGTNWVDWPGSTNVSSEVIPLNTTNGSVFFRMVYP